MTNYKAYADNPELLKKRVKRLQQKSMKIKKANSLEVKMVYFV
jgi:hypothetical protein